MKQCFVMKNIIPYIRDMEMCEIPEDYADEEKIRVFGTCANYMTFFSNAFL